MLTLDQVAADAMVTEEAAERLLEALIRDSLVSSVPWLSGRSQYELTRTGRGAARALVRATNQSGNNVHERMMLVRRNTAPLPPPPMRRSPGPRRRVRQPIGKLRRVRQPAKPGTPGGPPAARRSTALGLAIAGLSAPFFVKGLLFFRGPFEVADTLFGLFFTISPPLWTYFIWSRSIRP
jgi:hypothetical protein